MVSLNVNSRKDCSIFSIALKGSSVTLTEEGIAEWLAWKETHSPSFWYKVTSVFQFYYS